MRQYPPRQWIVEGRAARDWTQTELAQAAGVSVMTVVRAEKGRPIKSDTLDQIARVFGLSAVPVIGSGTGSAEREAPSHEATDDHAVVREATEDLEVAVDADGRFLLGLLGTVRPGARARFLRLCRDAASESERDQEGDAMGPTTRTKP